MVLIGSSGVASPTKSCRSGGSAVSTIVLNSGVLSRSLSGDAIAAFGATLSNTGVLIVSSGGLAAGTIVNTTGTNLGVRPAATAATLTKSYPPAAAPAGTDGQSLSGLVYVSILSGGVSGQRPSVNGNGTVFVSSGGTTVSDTLSWSGLASDAPVRSCSSKVALPAARLWFRIPACRMSSRIGQAWQSAPSCQQHPISAAVPGMCSMAC